MYEVSGRLTPPDVSTNRNHLPLWQTSPGQKQASQMHPAEHNGDPQADLGADQMSLPWGLPYLLKVQGKADGWGWQ